MEKRIMRARLLDWYDAHARALPWRAPPGGDRRTEAYRVWLSEVMLQQTTVPHATPYFLTFTRRWPTVVDLARESDAEVMAAWAGLGYYARARNLLKCARAVADDHGGVFPGTEAGLLHLPGVGPYTAAAVAAIAFDQPANVVDGNVERVMSRLFAVETPMPDSKPELKALASGFIDDASDRHGDWAQALMDLGATVCRPREPLCRLCPLQDGCAGYANGAANSYPRKRARAARPHRHGVAFIAVRKNCIALVRRPDKGLLGGMLALPSTEWRGTVWSSAEAVVEAPIAADWSRLGAVEHVFTHFSLTLEVVTAGVDADIADAEWVALNDAQSGLPSVFLKALRLLLARTQPRPAARSDSPAPARS